MDHREVIDDLNRKKEEIKLTQEARALRTSLVEERPLLVARRNAWEDLLPDSQTAEKADDGGELVLQMVGEIDALLRDLDRSEINLVGFMEAIEREPLQEALTAGKKRYEEALSYLDGITITLGEGTSAQEILAHYPDRALEVLEELSTEIDRLNQAITALQDRLRTDTTWRKPDIQAIFAEGETFLASLEPLSADISRSLSRGREELLEANRLRQEGDRRFQEARQLTARNEFAVAKERLTLAVNLYDQSLARQEVSELRRIRDQTIPDYFNEIRSRENSRVIQDVRGYLTQGQALYGRNEFAAANRLFLRAESRWRDTNANPNDEIVYWLELTQIALTVNSRRYLVSTDPLFTEISQYLNQATADYERGKRLLAGGNEEMANLAFDEAERNLFLVQQFFPYNKEVRILIIRIAQQRDSREFEELLGQDFKNAKAKIRLNPQEAYVELRNLEDLDPNFPGLQAAIEEAEYAAGIKIRPPDPVKMRRSRELYQQALAIVNSNVRTEFPMAQTFLNEAFAMSPTNQDILLLKDRVAVSLGGSTSVILTSVDQRKYTEAVDEFNNGNYLKAQILVDILLENANNRYNTRLLELKERIKSAR